MGDYWVIQLPISNKIMTTSAAKKVCQAILTHPLLIYRYYVTQSSMKYKCYSLPYYFIQNGVFLCQENAKKQLKVFFFYKMLLKNLVV